MLGSPHGTWLENLCQGRLQTLVPNFQAASLQKEHNKEKELKQNWTQNFKNGNKAFIWNKTSKLETKLLKLGTKLLKF